MQLTEPFTYYGCNILSMRVLIVIVKYTFRVFLPVPDWSWV